jgi:hypothetical protein
MVKIIQLEHEYDCEHLLGKFLDESHYDLVLNEDADVYRPLRFGEKQDETTILLKFRKNVLVGTKEAYEGLYSGATATDNRGLAAGSERTSSYQHHADGREGGRRWVTKREKAVLDYFLDGSPPSVYGDMAQELYDETPNTPLGGRGGSPVKNSDVIVRGGSIWIVKTANEVDFDTWFKETSALDPVQRRTAARALIKKHISETTYGESVLSGVGGSMDRYPRIPFCRQTAWTQSHREKFEMAFPLFEKANQVFSESLPERWSRQNELASKMDDHYRVSKTAYTTITINRSFRTACHRDAGDLCDPGTVPNPRGFSNLTVVTNDKKFDGFYLCFPEFRVAANIQNGDLIMMDAHRIHGNTPLISADPGFERISLVMYMREPMVECGSYDYEETRKRFVYSRKDNPEHPEWREKWNGISPGCFHSQEWKDYLYNNGFPEEAERVVLQ